MRHTTLGVAAFSACLMLTPMTAGAFEFDSTGGASPGAAANYADPYADLYEKKAAEQPSEAPNGAKVLDALEDVLQVQRGGLTRSRDVLARFGNMSAATVLFVLAESLAAGTDGWRLLTSMGPGFTTGFLLLGGD